MSPGPAHALSLLGLALALGCSAPQQRYAASEAYLVRFELATAERPDSLEGWYACFETEDMESRKLCLSNVPGVRVDAGHGARCAEPGDPATLCRAFPYFTPDRVADEDEEDSDGDSGSGLAGAVAEGLVRVFFALVSSHDDADDGDRQNAPAKSSSRRDRRYTISKPEPRRDYRTKTPRPR